MTEISRSALFGRLNPTALKAIETATGFCRIRGNPYVELAHWLHILLQDGQNDVAAFRTAFRVDDAIVTGDVLVALDRLPRGATAVSDFAPQIEEAIEKAWLYASLMYGARHVRTGHLILAMLKTPTLRSLLFGISPEFRKLSAEQIGEEFASLVSTSAEGSAETAADPAEGAALPEAALGEALARFAVDLTARARAGEIDRIVGRDAEIRQAIDILLRRRQNNPILTGEAGVGKTAIVEGLARRIADGDVPPALKDVSLYALDIGLLQAGAGVKGEFEKRLRQVIDEVEGSPRPIILFIDEAHTLIGAGGQAGTGDAANLLKPALARGRLRTIAATTWAEYRQYFEKDPALTRRFQPIAVGEPETDRAIAMLRSLKGVMEKHHDVVVLDEAVQAAVRLSQRYIPARQLPDKAVSLLDTAAARVAVSQHATPAAVEDARRRIELLEVELEVATRESEGRYAPDGRAVIIEALEAARGERADLEARWEAEKAAIEDVSTARQAMLANGEGGEALDVALTRSRELRGDRPMVFGEVDADMVAAVVGDWTGIPVGRMVKDEIASVLVIEERLKRRVIGQDEAMDAIARRVRTSRAKLDNPVKPVGVFLLCGPSGVGKTETAQALAELLYSGDDSLITINMSEFQEAHTVSTLKGAPAGYVGYGQGGVLTEAVRRRPYSVVLLDEVEKAHPDVHEMFFQVFDKGYMEDAEGRYIDFRNTLILLTSNVGTDLITTLCEDEEMAPAADGLAQALRPELLKVFPPALLGRLTVLPYRPLAPAVLRDIVRLQLDRVVRRVDDNLGARLDYDEAVVELIVSRCQEVASGGRMIDAILTNSMLPELSVTVLERQAVGGRLASIHVGADGQGFTYRYTDRDEAAEPRLEAAE
ncbi:type VI secretion system ATPase TssH [Sphingomonas oligoaromativorans]|uniref:type VI secretion system ATPase TssH n=1 Tax=Sphingomonas oligoaromativorans TaxID=575322 RepID=UPI0014234D41|nr:type VI secretion system ATPase TssH [Sphingomonas oligoaromativorans]NIJ32485.1 type VI secretion system protein VasG [Sphingomonas oligoaromativorans]